MLSVKKYVQKQVDWWNKKVPIGTTVWYRSFPDNEPKEFTTRTEAQALGGHTAVVWLRGKSGAVALSNCSPVFKVYEEQSNLPGIEV